MVRVQLMLLTQILIIFIIDIFQSTAHHLVFACLQIFLQICTFLHKQELSKTFLQTFYVQGCIFCLWHFYNISRYWNLSNLIIIITQVPASTPSVHSGWLVLRPPGSKSVSNKRYFILLSDFVLYSFRSEVDNSALTATPLPGFTILTGAQLKGDSGSGCSEKDRDKVIKMFHPSSKRTYYFAGTNPSDVERYNNIYLAWAYHQMHLSTTLTSFIHISLPNACKITKMLAIWPTSN